jgi:hypothetical protein
MGVSLGANGLPARSHRSIIGKAGCVLPMTGRLVRLRTIKIVKSHLVSGKISYDL